MLELNSLNETSDFLTRYLQTYDAIQRFVVNAADNARPNIVRGDDSTHACLTPNINPRALYPVQWYLDGKISNMYARFCRNIVSMDWKPCGVINISACFRQ